MPGIPQNAFPVLGGLSIVLAICYTLAQLLRYRQAFSVEGKVVVVTGASSGLGEALAHAFYKAGAKVILCARRHEELKRVKKDLVKLIWPFKKTYEPHLVPLDLSNFKEIPKVVDTIKKFHGTIDLLINNAGMSFRGDILSTSLEVDQQLMNVNYLGQVALTKAVLPIMVEKKQGHIVGVSSVQGKLSIPFRSAYSSSKHALEAFFDCLRAEVDHLGIKVILIRPGYIQTQLSCNAVTGDGSQYGAMDETTASGMKPAIVANEIIFGIEHNYKDITMAPTFHKIVIYLRNLFPNIFYYVMVKRAKKQRVEMKKCK